MIYTQHFCAKCSSAAIRRTGSKKGRPKYQCTACRYQGLFIPAVARRAAHYAQVDALLSERNSQRGIVRLTGVARMTIAKRIKKAAFPSPPRLPRRPANARRKRWEVPEPDELWRFAGHKRRKLWPWLAIERARRRIVDGRRGSRGKAPLRQRWQSLPAHCHHRCWFFTDATVLPTPRSCRAGSTGPAPKARGGPAPSGPLLVPSASAAACSCARPARSTSRWPCTRAELKL